MKDMGPAEREAYEWACLEAVKRQFGNAGALLMHKVGRVLRDITLDGKHPDTAIKVRYLNKKTGQEEDELFHLWRGWLSQETHAFPDPERVALFVYVESIEP